MQFCFVRSRGRSGGTDEVRSNNESVAVGRTSLIFIPVIYKSGFPSDEQRIMEFATGRARPLTVIDKILNCVFHHLANQTTHRITQARHAPNHVVNCPLEGGQGWDIVRADITNLSERGGCRKSSPQRSFKLTRRARYEFLDVFSTLISKIEQSHRDESVFTATKFNRASLVLIRPESGQNCWT